MIEYFKLLRERICECIITIIHCLKDIGKVKALDEIVPGVLSFIERMSNVVQDITIVVLFKIGLLC